MISPEFRSSSELSIFESLSEKSMTAPPPANKPKRKIIPISKAVVLLDIVTSK